MWPPTSTNRRLGVPLLNEDRKICAQPTTSGPRPLFAPGPAAWRSSRKRSAPPASGGSDRSVGNGMWSFWAQEYKKPNFRVDTGNLFCGILGVSGRGRLQQGRNWPSTETRGAAPLGERIDQPELRHRTGDVHKRHLDAPSRDASYGHSVGSASDQRNLLPQQLFWGPAGRDSSTRRRLAPERQLRLRRMRFAQ